MAQGHKHRRVHRHREDLTGEHALNDIGQLVLACLFAVIWIADSFFLKFSTALNDQVPLALRMPLAAIFLGLAGYLARSGLNLVFGEEYAKYMQEVPMWIPRLRKRVQH